MKSILMRVIACCALVFPWAVSATPALTTAACTVGPGICATGITGLINVGAYAYDVTFNYSGSYNDVYAGNPAPTLGSSVDATNVGSAILSFLSSSTVDGIVANASPPGGSVPVYSETGEFLYTYYGSDYFFVPYNLNTGPTSNFAGPSVDLVFGYHNFGAGWEPTLGECDNFNGCLDPAISYAESISDGSAYNWVVFTKTGPANTGEVPEPASLALLGIGLAGLGFARRKKA